ncbi:MAG: PaaI family thioesterase [Desulfomonilaceae bacterium]
MRELNPQYVTEVSAGVNQCPYFQLLSMRLVELELGRAVLRIRLAEKHLQPFGVVHGGVFSSIIDAAAFWAVFSEVDEDTGMTTVDLKVNYLAPASQGVMIATGQRIKLGKTLGLAEATVTDEEGRILAHGTSTLIILPNFPFRGPTPLPPKFLEISCV